MKPTRRRLLTLFIMGLSVIVSSAWAAGNARKTPATPMAKPRPAPQSGQDAVPGATLRAQPGGDQTTGQVVPLAEHPGRMDTQKPLTGDVFEGSGI